MLSRLKHWIFQKGGMLIIHIPPLYAITRHFISNLKVLEIKSLYEYVYKSKNIIKLISDDVVREYEKASADIAQYESGNYKNVEMRSCSRQYVSILHDAMVRNDTDGIIQGESYYTDKMDFDKKGLCEHPPSRAIIKDNKILLLDKRQRAIREIDHAVFLVKMWSYNYFHFVFEGLSRLGSIDSLNEYKEWPIILDESVKADCRNIDILNLLNVNNREVIWLKNSELIRVKNLLIPACMTWAVWDVSVSLKNGWGYMISKEAGNYLRDTILSGYKPQRKYNCVYVARGNNKRLTNETQIIDTFGKAGFEIFYPDKAKTFQEELDCFATAKCIVLCAGGASTNLVFCDKNIDIFCILPYKYRCDSAQDITYTVGINVKLRNAIIEEDNGILMKSKFWFPLDKCQEIIEYCKRKKYL